MVSEKSFVGKHFGFQAADMIEFITTYEESFSTVLFFKEICVRNNLHILHLYFQRADVDADGC